MPRRPTGPAIVGFLGLPELHRDLAALPQTLVDGAAPILEAWGNRTAAAISRAYPVGEYSPGSHQRGGVLAGGVRSKLERGAAFGVRAKVVSGAPHAHLWERGTKPRRTKKGWRRGSMPKPNPPVFVPHMQAARRALVPEIAALMRSLGLEVTGSADG